MPKVLLGSVLATSYFVFHAVFGTHGLLANGKLVERSQQIDREIAVLEAVRSRLREDLAALATEPPQPDIVEESARTLLGFMRNGDLMVIQRRPQRSSLATD